MVPFLVTPPSAHSPPHRARHENDEYFTPQEFVNAIKTGEVDALHCFCAKSPSLVGLPIDTLKAATKARVGRSRSGGYFASCHIYDHKAEQCHFYGKPDYFLSFP